MAFKYYLDGDVAVVEVDIKHLDASTSSDFMEQLNPISDEHSKIVLDLAKVQFIDSSGIGMMMTILRKVQNAGGDVCIARVDHSVSTVMDLMRVERFLNLFTSIEEAVASF